jgi:ATP-dependent Clp protease ATP-binding subunit ClpA
VIDRDHRPARLEREQAARPDDGSGTEHLLLALASDDGLAGSTLEHFGVSPECLTEQIQRIIGPGHSAESATLGITRRTKRVLEAARKAARRLGHRCADAEHLLLAVSETEGAAEQMLREAGAQPGDVRAQLAALLENEAPEVAAKLRAPARGGYFARELDRLPGAGGGRTIRLVPG